MGHNGNQVTRLRTMPEKVRGSDSGFTSDWISFFFAVYLFSDASLQHER
jgi:hypothetical protein